LGGKRAERGVKEPAQKGKNDGEKSDELTKQNHKPFRNPVFRERQAKRAPKKKKKKPESHRLGLGLDSFDRSYRGSHLLERGGKVRIRWKKGGDCDHIVPFFLQEGEGVEESQSRKRKGEKIDVVREKKKGNQSTEKALEKEKGGKQGTQLNKERRALNSGECRARRRKEKHEESMKVGSLGSRNFQMNRKKTKKENFCVEGGGGTSAVRSAKPKRRGTVAQWAGGRREGQPMNESGGEKKEYIQEKKTT